MEWQETMRALGRRAVLGKEVISEAAFTERVKRGLPTSTITELKRFSRLSDSDLAEVIPRRTLTSIKRVSRLTPEQSKRIACTAGIAALAQLVLGDVDTAREWLMTPNLALGGYIPLRLLRTGSGTQLVESVLLRIEYGVYE